MHFQWLAVYGRDDVLAQFPREGGENKYADIDRSRLASFVVLTREETPRPVFVVHIPKGGRLIYRQRVEPRGDGTDIARVWLVGCQWTENEHNAQFVAAIFEDAHIEITNGFKEGTPWFYSPKLHPHAGEDWVGLTVD